MTIRPAFPARLMDRIDLRVEVPAVTAADLIRPNDSETSADVAKRVARARQVQRDRYAGLGLSTSTNATASNTSSERCAEPDAAGNRLLQEAAEAMRFSARGYHRILKVARTLADLDGAVSVGRIHLAEAISYRMAGERLAQVA